MFEANDAKEYLQKMKRKNILQSQKKNKQPTKIFFPNYTNTQHSLYLLFAFSKRQIESFKTLYFHLICIFISNVGYSTKDGIKIES